jgi:hypothetical protein
MSSLRLQFSDFYTKVHNFTTAPGVPTGDDLTQAKSIVYRAYRKFLYPIDIKAGETHTWSWLIKEGTLKTIGGVDTYELPEDFDALYRPITFTLNTGRYGRVTKTSYAKLMIEKSFNTLNSSPLICAIIPETATTTIDQHKKIVFWPLPDGEYQLNYSYICMPPKPVNNTDVFLGNAKTDEALLQVCLAVAEQEQDEVIGVQSKLAAEAVQALILNDSTDAPDTVGMVTDGNITQRPNIRDYVLRNTQLQVDW